MVRSVLVLGSDSYAEPWKRTYPGIRIGVLSDGAPITQYDAIQFCGGTDVCAYLYGEGPRFEYDLPRDMRELEIFLLAVRARVPMFGICRGSQFLRVACGGRLHQDIKGHGLRTTHPAVTTDIVNSGDSVIEVTSTHHQAAVYDPKFHHYLFGPQEDGYNDVVEAWGYPAFRVWAVQYHPEYMDPDTHGFRFYQDLLRHGMGEKGSRWTFNHSNV